MKAIIKRLAEEPLVQFLVLGGLLFALAPILAGRATNARGEILVDRAQVEYQRNLFHGQFGTYPDEPRLNELLDNYIRDEVLYREAQRIGLDVGDEIVRRRLVQKMEFLLSEETVQPQATDQALEAYYERNAAKFLRPARVSFTQLYFEDGPRGKPARERALAALAALGRPGAAPARVGAAPFPLGNDFVDLDSGEVGRDFGQGEFSAALFTVPPGEWAGPFQSGFGWHLIKVHSRDAATVAPLAAVRGEVEAAWLRDYREARARAKIAELSARYRIVRRDREPSP